MREGFDLDGLRLEAENRDGLVFPSRTYAETVLAPMYNDVKENLLEYMHRANKAHLTMLYEESIISPTDALSIKKALQSLPLDSFKERVYTGEYEDLFFEVEAALIKLGGNSVGNLHIARSRNDLGVALYRLVLRDRLLKLIREANTLQKTFAAFAKAHADTFMIAHTHTQQAQPSTLGHYIAGAAYILGRDIDRLKNAYMTVNRSSMGAAAITTSGFPINRESICRLLGFDSVIENSYDAIGGGDFIGEAATAIHLSCINLGRVVYDLLLWSTQEFGYLKVAPPYIQISSIMPQKRNPVSIEHSRALLSSASGDCMSLLHMLHNTPYGDIVDTEDDSQPALWRALEKLSGVYRLLANVVATLTVDKEQMAKRARESYSVITELADTLVREEDVSFRQAHKVAHNLVSHCLAHDIPLSSVSVDMINEAFKAVFDRDIKAAPDIILKSLSYENFVAVRKVQGGPEKNELLRSLEEVLFVQVQTNIDWEREKSRVCEESMAEVERRFEDIS